MDDWGGAEKLLSERTLLVYPREPVKLTLKMAWKTTVSSPGTACIGTLPNVRFSASGLTMDCQAIRPTDRRPPMDLRMVRKGIIS